MSTVSRRTALAAALSVGIGGAAKAAPSRVVSLNPCLDTLLVHLADRKQIAALSHYARQDQQSTIADIARTFPFTYESAEEIIGMSPDLVLGSVHSALPTRQALQRLGIDVVTFTVPNSIDEGFAQIATLASLIGQEARGEKLTARIRQALADAAAPPGRKPIQALVFQPRGLVAGDGTLIDDVMRRTGFENVARRYGVKQWGTLRLEQLINDPPELLLSGQASPGASTWSERLISHPALASIAPRMRRAVFPEANLYCGGPVLLKTAPILAKARNDYWSAI